MSLEKWILLLLCDPEYVYFFRFEIVPFVFGGPTHNINRNYTDRFYIFENKSKMPGPFLRFLKNFINLTYLNRSVLILSLSKIYFR